LQKILEVDGENTKIKKTNTTKTEDVLPGRQVLLLTWLQFPQR